MILAGEVALWVALLLAGWSAVVSALAARTSRRAFADNGAWAAYALPVALLLACAGLVSALLGNDFALRQVAEHSSVATPWPYRVSALWAGEGGSLLLWSVALAVHGALLARALRRARVRDDTVDALAPAATAIVSTLVLALLATLMLAQYPYARLPWPAPDGAGLSPELRHPAMAVHPPLLHFGYAALAAPFALAMAALLVRDARGGWFPLARRWATASWTLLTAAILLGMRWALVTPGWEGLWQWEPVQSLAFLAWVVAALLAHASVLAARWSPLRTPLSWAAGLALPVALLGLASAHAGESGGRHAFRGSPAEAPLVALVLVVSATAVRLLAWRLRGVASPWPGDANAARPEGANVGAWLAHAGLVLLAVGLGARLGARTYDVTLSPAQSVELTDPFGGVWRFTSQGESRGREGSEEVTAVGLALSRDGASLGLIAPEMRQQASPDGQTEGRAVPGVAIRESVAMEMSVMMTDLPNPVAPFRVAFHPLGVLVWLGGALAVIGGITAFVTRR
ncbi:MAG TPA: cytochrome c biogenesis protein CcsA [Gemmatimonadaceae bacterium]